MEGHLSVCVKQRVKDDVQLPRSECESSKTFARIFQDALNCVPSLFPRNIRWTVTLAVQGIRDAAILEKEFAYLAFICKCCDMKRCRPIIIGAEICPCLDQSFRNGVIPASNGSMQRPHGSDRPAIDRRDDYDVLLLVVRCVRTTSHNAVGMCAVL